MIYENVQNVFWVSEAHVRHATKLSNLGKSVFHWQTIVKQASLLCNTDEDIIISNALLIVSALLLTNQTVTKINNY